MSNNAVDVEIDFTKNFVNPDSPSWKDDFKETDGFAVIYPDGTHPVLACDFSVKNTGLASVRDLHLNFENNVGIKLFERDILIVEKLERDSAFKFDKIIIFDGCPGVSYPPNQLAARTTGGRHPAVLWDVMHPDQTACAETEDYTGVSDWTLIFRYIDLQGNRFRNNYRLCTLATNPKCLTVRLS